MIMLLNFHSLESDDTLAGRRVVISCDGGRVRLREKKRGPKTKKGRSRGKGDWRESKATGHLRIPCVLCALCGE